MASLISDVIKDVFKEASEKKITLTPDNYHMLFCAAAARRGLGASECKKLESYISKLDQNYQNDIKNILLSNYEDDNEKINNEILKPFEATIYE